METLRKTIKLIRLVLEEYLTGIAFIVMLLTMVYSIVMRYIFKSPITWGLELQSICFVCLVFLGIGLSEHDPRGEHWAVSQLFA